MKMTFGQVRIPSGSELASGEDICAHMTHTEVKKKLMIWSFWIVELD